MSDDNQNDTIHFGAGCFHFGVKKLPPASFTGKDYVEALRQALGKITNLSELKIDADDDFLEREIQIDEPATKLSQGPDFFPGPGSRLDVSFQLYIPRRLHQELITWHPDVFTSSERFVVDMRSPYFFPTTFLQPLDPSPQTDPSEDVILLRMFLLDQFERMENDFIRFDFLGPSPFHADFCLKPREAQADISAHQFGCEIQKRRGYDRVVFSYDPDGHENVMEARDALFYHLEDELGLFYMINHMQCMQNRKWEAVEACLNRMMQEKEAHSICAVCKKVIAMPRRVEDVVLALTEFEKQALLFDHSIKKAYRDLTGSGRNPFLDDFIEKEQQDSIQYPTHQVRELVSLVESRRSKAQEALVLLLSAILGGVVGATITLLATPSPSVIGRHDAIGYELTSPIPARQETSSTTNDFQQTPAGDAL